MATTITRTGFTDDDGSGTVGSLWNNALIHSSIYDPFDATLAGGAGKDPFVIGGTIAINGRLVMSGQINPTILSASQNDYNPTNLANAFYLHLTSTVALSITGIAGGTQGRWLWLHYRSGFTISLQHENAASVAGNRIICPNNVAHVLTQYRNCLLFYENTRWKILV